MLNLTIQQSQLMERVDNARRAQRDCVLTQTDAADATICAGLGLLRLAGDGSAAELTEAGRRYVLDLNAVATVVLAKATEGHLAITRLVADVGPTDALKQLNALRVNDAAEK